MSLVWPAAYRVAFGILRDRGLAEDAAQEACASIARSLPDLKRSDVFRSWAYRIVVNRAISIGRKRRPEADLADVQAASHDDAVTRLDLFRALDHLPLKQRAIVVLHYYVGLNSGEIAAACEMPSSSIRFHLMMARRALRHALAVTESPTPNSMRRDSLMVSESQLRANFFDMLERLVVPETPSASIRARVDALPVDRVERYRLKPWVPAAAAAFIVAFSLPVVAPGFTLSIEERIARILQWSPPPVPVSPSLRPMLRGRVLDLAAAKRAVDFRIVVPAGLPAGSVSTVIRVASKGIYSAKTHRWVAASKYVEFEYARRDGGTFDLIAAPGSSLAAAPSRYMLEERGTDKKGNPMVVRRERFVWRNGSQVMTAIVGDHLSAAEILAIRDAMHGFPVATVWPPKPSHGAALLLHP